MTKEQAALEYLLNQARTALVHKQNKGGQQCGYPDFVMCTPSILRDIERTCLHGLGYDPSEPEPADHVEFNYDDDL